MEEGNLAIWLSEEMSRSHSSCVWHKLGSLHTTYVFLGVISQTKTQEHYHHLQTSEAFHAMYSV